MLCPDLGWLVGVSLFALMAGCLLEATDLDRSMLRSVDCGMTLMWASVEKRTYPE